MGQGVSPEEAAARAGLTAGVELLNASGVTDEALGAAVKKSGLLDTVVELGRKIPGGKQIIDSVEERLDKRLFKAGMDMYDQDLTQAQEKEWIKLNEHLYGYTDEEVGAVAKALAQNMELTTAGTNDSLTIDFQFFASPSKQFGKKAGKHAYDYGLDPSSEKDRETLRGIIQNITDHATEQRIGEWRGYSEAVVFHILGDDVVITDQMGEFISILKGGISNARVKNARKR